jgi:cyclase
MNFVKEASKKFGTQCMVVAVDAKKISNGKWEIFTHGGREKTGIDAIEFAKKAEAYGAGEILLTSMDKDGTKTGYDIDLLKQVTTRVSIPVIASGGVGNLEHFYEGIIKGGASAVLAASIFHYGEHTIQQAKEYLASKDVPVRIKQ